MMQMVIDGLVRCVHPGIDGHVSFGTVLNVDYDAGLMQSYMDVEDLEGRVLNAIKEYGCDLTVLGNYGNSAPGVGTRGRVCQPVPARRGLLFRLFEFSAGAFRARLRVIRRWCA